MVYYEVSMHHTEKTFEALSRMQYDLFCKENRLLRTILSLILIAAGIFHFSTWWGILLVAYGCYLTTSTYSAANHTAHKLAAGIKESGLPFPASRYVFGEKELEITSLPKETKEASLPYSGIHRLGEDREYFYIFRDQYGGYMIPKAELQDKVQAFRIFLQEKTGMSFRMHTIPAVRFAKWVQSQVQKKQGKNAK